MMSNITYKPEDFSIGEETVYVFYNKIKIGWIAAREEYEPGKIYFCLNPKRKSNPRIKQLDSISGQTHIFDRLQEMEEWIRNKLNP
jgi:hypothetical protein